MASFDVGRFESVLAPEKYEELVDATVRALDLFDGRVVWNVNSTARGGGVAEMLQSLLAYARGAGVDARWAVIEGAPEFFKVTKRIHNHLHGAPGDAGSLGDHEHQVYEETLDADAEELLELIGPRDVVIVHDPQPAGLTERLRERAAAVVWRCHVGLDTPNDVARAAWNFLLPYVTPADRYVFSRSAYAWERLDRSRVTVIPPSIDAFSPKNQDMEDDAVEAIVVAAGLVQGKAGNPVFLRWDQTEGRIERRAEMYEGGPPPPPEARLVVQVSRWDRLKDPV
ncbi:MAG TPA: glycosyl transferase family 1, partial [Actinomycetota bacterium]|nr:glycosyl transferase family 1 [Actinomycetota bacterium]